MAPITKDLLSTTQSEARQALDETVRLILTASAQQTEQNNQLWMNTGTGGFDRVTGTAGLRICWSNEHRSFETLLLSPLVV